MNIAYLGAHSILEYDELRLLTLLGHDVFSIGSYLDPANPTDDKRPAISGMTYHPELAEACPDTMAAKEELPEVVLEWADTIIVAAYPGPWITVPWDRIKRHRVIWRTIGQSGPDTEEMMRPYFDHGLEIVRYSPAERRAFEPMGVFAGETAMIRFGKDPTDWYGWTGSDPVVGNITQNMIARGEFTNFRFYRAATEGLPAKPAGPGSEGLPGGVGSLDYEAMREYLRRVRCYLYTGTQPASYTLGLMEALLTGTPVISIAPDRMWLPALFEGHEIAPWRADDPAATHAWLETTLARPVDAAWDAGTPLAESRQIRDRAIELFSYDVIAPQWADLLGAKVAVPA